MDDIAGWIAPIATMIAAMMTAANLGAKVTGSGFLVFTIGSICWSLVGLSTGQTNLLATKEPSLVPYAYLRGHFRFLDIFGFNTALEVAQQSVAKSGDYALQKYGLESAQWPPQRPVEG